MLCHRNGDDARGSLGYAKHIAAMVVAIDAGSQRVHVAVGRPVEAACVGLFDQLDCTAFEFGSIVTVDLVVVTPPTGGVADALQLEPAFANQTKVTVHQTLDHFLRTHQFRPHEYR